LETLKILIVQNELPQADRLKALLESWGYDVKWANPSQSDTFAVLPQKDGPSAFLDIQKNEKEDDEGLVGISPPNGQKPIQPSDTTHFLDVIERKKTPTESGSRADKLQVAGDLMSKKVAYPSRSGKDVFKKKMPSSHSFFFEDSLFIRSNSALVKLKFEDIIYLEADANYTQIFTEGKKYIIRASLKDLEEKLNDRRFARVHKSFLINLEKIESVQADFIQIADREIPIARQQHRWLLGQIKIL
jgi:hypothetical protein